jgi:serine protease Do
VACVTEKIRTQSKIADSLKLFTVIASLQCVTASAATLAPGVQQKLTNSTFEVVLAKPVADPLTYEKPLPLELIPYRERTDKFQSIGTAFAIGPNRFVSAAHVISAGNGSQYGPLAIRNAAGATFRVDKIIKYSSSEDYAVFSVQGVPAVVPLETRSRPPLNTPVFAVGNAFGEGVVVRDGLYTSDTPEELEGRWQWLRFSAAASPGNSGGPLIDRNGKAVGVVVRKSPNENLNFALAIGQVLEGSEEAAVLESRSSYRMIVMKAADAISFNEKIALPKTLEDFYASVRQLTANFVVKVHSDYMKTHADAMFPRGNSEQLLTSVYAEAFPRLISQSDGGAWSLVGDAPRRVELDKHGYLQEGTANSMLFVRLKAPDDVSNADLVADSKKYMDLLLQGYPVTRPVGTDAVRVTSMGNASEELWFTDSYRRKWQIRSWLVPFNDSVIISVALPTPDGMVTIMAQAPTALREAVTREMEGLCEFVYVSYTGTTAQWYAFLSDLKVLPGTLLNKKVQLDSSHGVGIDSSRFKFLVPASVLRIDDGSVLMLKYSYMRDGASTVWDLGGVYLADSAQNRKWIGLLRRLKPSPSMPEETAQAWRAMAAGTPPWQGVPFLTSGRTEINAMVNKKDVAAGKTNIGYTMSLSYEGNQLPFINIHNEFSALEHGLTIVE